MLLLRSDSNPGIVTEFSVVILFVLLLRSDSNPGIVIVVSVVILFVLLLRSDSKPGIVIVVSVLILLLLLLKSDSSCGIMLAVKFVIVLLLLARSESSCSSSTFRFDIAFALSDNIISILATSEFRLLNSENIGSALIRPNMSIISGVILALGKPSRALLAMSALSSSIISALITRLGIPVFLTGDFCSTMS